MTQRDPGSGRSTGWLVFVIWRVVFFAVPFALILPLALSTNMNTLLAAIVSASLASLIGLSLSFLLLGSARERLATRLSAMRSRSASKTNPDEEVEDRVLDANV